MIPLKILKEDQIIDLKKDEFYSSIFAICENHKKEGKALAFALLIYDFENSNISQVLNNHHYWLAINKVSGKYISVFYVNSFEKYFAEDLAKNDGKEQRSLYQVNFESPNENLLPIIKQFLKIDELIKLPVMLFFQVNEKMVTDYLLIKLDEEKVEDTYLEIKKYLETASETLALIRPEYYGNFKEIFDNVKLNLKAKRSKIIAFKSIQQFPLKLLISWIIGKV